MDHLHATETHAAERYLLGELPAADAEDFELHFFECRHCAIAVESGQLFLAGARAHFREAPSAAPARAKRRGEESGHSFLESLTAFWRIPAFTLPAMAALALFAIYQNSVTIPGLNRELDTMAGLPATLLIGASRGEAIVLQIPRGSRVAAVEADVPPGMAFSRYECVLNAGGHEVLRTAVPAPEEGHPIALRLPARRLKPETYELAIYGVAPDGQLSDRISTYPFAVHFN